jgi:hypothetical protein
LHHSPLRAPTLFYRILLDPTPPHFAPHHRLLLAVVKRKTHNFFKRVELRVIWNCEENHRHLLYFPLRNSSIAGGVLLGLAEQFRGRRKPDAARQREPDMLCYRRGRARTRLWDRSLHPQNPLVTLRHRPSSLFLAPRNSCYALPAVISLKERPSHGMGYPSTRRDRPQLRDQLVRQRRTLAGRLCKHSGPRRRALFSFISPHHPHCLFHKCVYAP